MKPRPQERRYYATEFEARATPTGGMVIEGHAAVFNRLSQDLGGFVERVAPEAFNSTLRQGVDVRALFNHDSNLILGRTSAGTLDVYTDAEGLAYRVKTADPPRSYEQDLQISVQRGDVTQSSFGFRVIDDEWGLTERDYPLRTLREVSLAEGDVSPATFPAYLDTDVGPAMRSLRSRFGLEADKIMSPAEIKDLVSGKRGVYAPDERAPEHSYEDDGTAHCEVCSWTQDEHDDLYGQPRSSGPDGDEQEVVEVPVRSARLFLAEKRWELLSRP